MIIVGIPNIFIDKKKKRAMLKKPFFQAVALLVGTTIGAGIFGIPYVVAQSGFFTGLFMIIIVGVSILILNLFIGEICLRTKGLHQLSGYIGHYFKKPGKIIATIAMILGVYGSLLAYIIGEGKVIAAIFNGSELVYSIIFLFIVSIILFFGIKIVGRYEEFLVFFVLFLIFLIAVIGFGDINIDNLRGFYPNKMFIPYGTVLFAFLGMVAIPEMHEVLQKNKKQLRKAIIIGSLIPIIVYIIFALVVVGVSGISIDQVATTSLRGNLIFFGNIFAIFTMATSFLALSLAMREMYEHDLKMNRYLSFILTISVPFILFLLGFKSFIKTISFTGSMVGGIMGILVILTLWKSKLKSIKSIYSVPYSKVLGVILILMFIVGIIISL